MSDRKSINPVSAALGTAFAASLAAGSASADTGTNPFGVTDLGSGYQVAQSEGRCGEGKCGASGEREREPSAEGRCGGSAEGERKQEGEGRCGGSGEGRQHGEGNKSGGEGRCGEGKCGGSR